MARIRDPELHAVWRDRIQCIRYRFIFSTETLADTECHLQAARLTERCWTMIAVRDQSVADRENRLPGLAPRSRPDERDRPAVSFIAIVAWLWYASCGLRAGGRRR
jgi:hypothetical protein